MPIIALNSLFVAALFFVFVNLLTIVYLDDKLHGASLRTLGACICCNGLTSLILYTGPLLFEQIPFYQAYFYAVLPTLIMQGIFWHWWFNYRNPHIVKILLILAVIAAFLALGAYYGLQEYAHIVGQ